jgi:hypothetical protein
LEPICFRAPWGSLPIRPFYVFIRVCVLMIFRRYGLVSKLVIVIYSEPTATLHAKVSAIGAVPINYSDEAVYPVTLVVEDPEGKRFSGASVQIQLLPGVR